MAMTPLPHDFKEFLRLLGEHKVEYLLIGGYAVGYHGYPRGTADIDVWVRSTPENARRVIEVLRQFGFNDPSLKEDSFKDPKLLVRMGVPPMRVEVLTSVSGLTFDDAHKRRETIEAEGIEIDVICKADLIANKKASGRTKDEMDLSNLP